MKKAVSIILAIILLTLTVTATANAEIVNQSALQFTDEAISVYEAQTGASVPTSRIYFKMPAVDNWYSDYSVYQGKYYAGIYWWGSDTVNPETYPGYRASIDDYEQGVYYADIPDGVALAIWDNGFYATQAERETEKYRQMTHSVDLYVEGAWEGDFDTLPEGSPNEENMDGCIFVYDPDSVVVPEMHPSFSYSFQPYIYYGNGCYGSYAQTSDNFISVEANCLNPEHFDADGNHIGGAHLQAPAAPASAPVDTEPESAINGWYFVTDREPDVIRSENKLYYVASDNEYYRCRYISQSTRFKLVHYMDGAQVSDCEQYPADGWINKHGEINSYPTGSDYNVFFRPDGSGGETYIDGMLKAVLQEQYPTELCEEKPTQPPTSTNFGTPTEPNQPTEPSQGQLYKERLKAFYNLDDCDYSTGQDGLVYYKELYYHQDKNGETDWALVNCSCNYGSPMPVTAIIGSRVIETSNWEKPFQTGYGVYDVKNDKFVDAVYTDPAQYDGFTKVTKEVLTGGRLLGDLDGDNDISIIDATIIQRCEAKIRSYPEDDAFYLTADFGATVHYYSDFDRDGERDVTDATKLQRYLVNG
ncbi:MAG: dockerin type I repeat-containing protein [Ruminococcus sp.]|nr:dockerin type I repeat-containing protein [Ruminococcus sp.]